MRTLLLAIATVVAMQGQTRALDVPLVVREMSGVARIGNPVNSGIPLPKGAVKEPGELRLVDAFGNVVPASIEPRSRWLEDGSLQWVTVHFVTDLKAGGTLQYRLITSTAPAPSESPRCQGGWRNGHDHDRTREVRDSDRSSGSIQTGLSATRFVQGFRRIGCVAEETRHDQSHSPGR